MVGSFPFSRLCLLMQTMTPLDSKLRITRVTESLLNPVPLSSTLPSFVVMPLMSWLREMLSESFLKPKVRRQI